MKTIDELLIEAKNRGLVIRQWHERVTHPVPPGKSVAIGDWWCELMHTKNGWRDSDIGKTAQESLHEALERAKGLKGQDNRPINLPAPKKPRNDASLVELTDDEAELM